MADSVLTEVSLGLDQAKETMYKIMQKYYPKIRTSKSTLLNATISGIAYIYSMFQVFGKLLQNELYVSEARELESLYKLIPFVGITLNEPTTMKLDASCKPQDEGITSETDEPFYVTSVDPFVDSNSYKFNQRYHQYLRKNIFDFSKRWADDTAVGVTTGSKKLTISIGKLVGSEYVPVSSLLGDILTVEFPYKDTNANVIKRGKVKFNVIIGSPILFGSDNGSDNPADLFLGNGPTYCVLWPYTGVMILALNGGAPVSFDDPDLSGLPVNATFNVRSIYRKSKAYSTEPVATFDGGLVVPYGFYSLSNVFAKKNTGEFKVTNTVEANTAVLAIWTGSGYSGYKYGMPIDPYSVKLTHTTDSSIVFDFSNEDVTEVFDDIYWGTIYRTYYTPDGGTTKYYAYVLDAAAGIIFYEDPLAADPLTFTIDVTTAPNNKVTLEQFESKVRSVAPPSEFNFDNNTFVLEDADPILFDQLKIQISDPGYTACVFTQVFSLATVQGNGTTQTYYEVRVLSPNKIELKFGDDIVYSSIENLLITYKAVKNLATYKSGERMTGTATLSTQDGTLHSFGGLTTFAFDGTNISSQAGAAGIPSLESLRDLLMKAAYTLDRNVTRLNYEYAIQNYFIGSGADARIKVFGYEDFGNIYLDSVNGNVLFFVGLINRYPNSDFILTVPTELDATAQYDREWLDGHIPGAITDTDLTMVNFVGKQSSDVDNLQNAIRDDSCVTNVVLSEGNGSNSFIRMYAVYFKALLKPKDGYTFAEAEAAVKEYLASLFKWSTMQFVRDINVSDVYREVDSLPSVDRILFKNFSHYKNNGADGPVKVHDILYKKKFTEIDIASIKLDAINTGNKYALSANVTASLTAVASGNKIQGANWTSLGFFSGMTVDITGFVASSGSNNKNNVNVVSADATDLVLEAGTADGQLTLIDETHSAKVVYSFNLASVIQTGRRITVTGFSTPANNVTNALVSAAYKEYIVMDTDEVDLADESVVTATIEDLLELMENPLWDFSSAATDRLIKIDVLALGGVEMELY